MGDAFVGKIVVNPPTFAPGCVPVEVAARDVFKKDASWVRAGIIDGWLPIGDATRDGKKVTDLSEMDGRHGRISYAIYPMLLWALTGYVWKG